MNFFRGFFIQKGQSVASRSFNEFFEQIPKQGSIPKAGRAWTAPELRLKSFEDLHKLWYVLLKERNVLFTQKETIKEMSHPKQFSNVKNKIRKVSQSMARLQTIITERKISNQQLAKLKTSGYKGESAVPKNNESNSL
eukprot:TRINITY_DN1317_c0_g1_i1.p1 TRINITY_DN1317_c0_g1~~TRINITY_DN1317_c0_g1_i1.p1  ORF type:complete len:138 (+),score=43.71 TRINITY_DN1317_c0_g1_i1:117-530(+)